MFFFIRQKAGLALILLCYSLSASAVDIQIDGLEEEELLDNVRAYLSLEQQKNHPRLSESRIRRLYKKAPDEIKRALQPFGYYRVKVTSELKRPTAGRTAWQAQYKIDLGDEIKIQTVNLTFSGEGENDSIFQKLQADLPVKVNKTLKHSDYEKAKRMLRMVAEEHGYFDAELTKHQIEIDEQKYFAIITLSFNTGRRYRFGDVTFKQNFFDESLLRRFLTFKPGEFYTGNTSLRFKNALISSDYFDNVDINLARSSPTEDLRLPVEVTLQPRKPNKYTAGIGYGTDTGGRGSLGWERRYLNRYGHRFSAKTEQSEIRQSATARYYIPMGQRPDDFLTITTGYKDESPDTSDSKLFLVGISKHHPRILYDIELGEIIGLEYRDDNYVVGSDKGHSKLLMPNGTWSYVKADDPIYTWNGHKIQWKLRGALSGVGSNTSFWQTRLSATLIRRVFKKGRVITRGDAGYSDIVRL